MEGLRKFCLTAFDIISIVGQKYSNYKKNFFIQIFSDFIYLFLAFSPLFCSFI